MLLNGLTHLHNHVDLGAEGCSYHAMSSTSSNRVDSTETFLRPHVTRQIEFVDAPHLRIIEFWHAI